MNVDKCYEHLALDRDVSTVMVDCILDRDPPTWISKYPPRRFSLTLLRPVSESYLTSPSRDRFLVPCDFDLDTCPSFFAMATTTRWLARDPGKGSMRSTKIVLRAHVYATTPGRIHGDVLRMMNGQSPNVRRTFLQWDTNCYGCCLYALCETRRAIS